MSVRSGHARREVGLKGDIQVGDYLVQPQLNRIVSSESVLTIEPKVMDVLVFLAEHSGDVLAKETILGAVWPDTIVTDDALKHAIFELRKAFRDDASDPRYVETIPRRGYRLIASVSEGFIDPAGEPHVNALPIRSWAKLGGLAVLLGLVILIGLKPAGLSDRFWDSSDGARIRSLAVLPLENLSGAVDQDYFADGMTDVLITEMSKIRALRVISRTSVMKYKGLERALPEIARELGVDAVIEGSVMRAGNSVRITAQLIKADPVETHVWANAYEGEMNEILALQKNVARAIADAIKLELTTSEQEAMDRRALVSASAFEAYLKGRHHWAKRTPADFELGLAYFQQAIDEDPSYTSAYIGLADGYILVGGSGLVPSAEAFPKARAALGKALEIDPTLGEAHASLALVRGISDWDWVGAEREFQLAIQLSPNYATAHHWYASLLSVLGRYDEALASIKRARELDPLSSIINTALGETLWSERQYDQALEEIEATLELDPDFLLANEILGRIYLAKGMYQEALAAFQKAAKVAGNSSETRANLGYCYAVVGQPDSAIRILEVLEQQSEEQYVSPYFIALVYAGLGRKGKAFEWLEEAFRERSPLLPVIVGALWDPLRDDPRYEGLLRKLNLPEDAIQRHRALP